MGDASWCGVFCSGWFTWQQDPSSWRDWPHGNPGKLGCQIWQPLRHGVWRNQGEERHVHTLTHSHTRSFHSNSQNPSVFLSCCITVTLLCARLHRSPSVSPWQHLAQVKLILTGASWIGRIQPGRWEPDFQGMQLITINTSCFRCD